LRPIFDSLGLGFGLEASAPDLGLEGYGLGLCLDLEASGLGLEGCGLGLGFGLEASGLGLGLKASGLGLEGCNLGLCLGLEASGLVNIPGKQISDECKICINALCWLLHTMKTYKVHSKINCTAFTQVTQYLQ